MADCIRVFVRLRPVSNSEKAGPASATSCLSIDGNTVRVGSTGKRFSFNEIFHGDVAQADVFQKCGLPEVADVVDGFDATILAYGQTGSGKTHSMFGPAAAPAVANEEGSTRFSQETDGIIPRCIGELFERMQAMDENGKVSRWSVSLSFMQIYQEKVLDLLTVPEAAAGSSKWGKGKEGISPNTSSPGSALPVGLKVRESKSDGVFVQNLSDHQVFSTGDVLELIARGETNRIIRASKMNAASSRSHSILQVKLSQMRSDGTGMVSRLNLCDLAGSERVRKTGVTGSGLEEAGKINLGLMILSSCVSALSEGVVNKSTGHVPYRDSRLTWILKGSLEGNTKTSILVTGSPHVSNLDETVSTFRFAERASSVKSHAEKHVVVDPQETIRELQSQVTRWQNYALELEEKLAAAVPSQPGSSAVVDPNECQHSCSPSSPSSSSRAGLPPSTAPGGDADGSSQPAQQAQLVNSPPPPLSSSSSSLEARLLPPHTPLSSLTGDENRRKTAMTLLMSAGGGGGARSRSSSSGATPRKASTGSTSLGDLDSGEGCISLRGSHSPTRALSVDSLSVGGGGGGGGAGAGVFGLVGAGENLLSASSSLELAELREEREELADRILELTEELSTTRDHLDDATAVGEANRNQAMQRLEEVREENAELSDQVEFLKEEIKVKDRAGKHLHRQKQKADQEMSVLKTKHAEDLAEVGVKTVRECRAEAEAEMVQVKGAMAAEAERSSAQAVEMLQHAMERMNEEHAAAFTKMNQRADEMASVGADSEKTIQSLKSHIVTLDTKYYAILEKVRVQHAKETEEQAKAAAALTERLQAKEAAAVRELDGHRQAAGTTVADLVHKVQASQETLAAEVAAKEQLTDKCEELNVQNHAWIKLLEEIQGDLAVHEAHQEKRIGLSYATSACQTGLDWEDWTPLDQSDPSWLPNSAAVDCFLCRAVFNSVWRAKHHCRRCGLIFCSDCSSCFTDGHRVCAHCKSLEHQRAKPSDEPERVDGVMLSPQMARNRIRRATHGGSGVGGQLRVQHLDLAMSGALSDRASHETAD